MTRNWDPSHPWAGWTTNSAAQRDSHCIMWMLTGSTQVRNGKKEAQGVTPFLHSWVANQTEFPRRSTRAFIMTYCGGPMLYNKRGHPLPIPLIHDLTTSIGHAPFPHLQKQLPRRTIYTIHVRWIRVSCKTNNNKATIAPRQMQRTEVFGSFFIP